MLTTEQKREILELAGYKFLRYSGCVYVVRAPNGFPTSTWAKLTKAKSIDDAWEHYNAQA